MTSIRRLIRPYVLLRDDYDTALKKGGIAIPAE
jgi:hypothetical protein